MLSKEEFKAIFNANYKDLLSYAYSYTNSIHHSEEIIQEVFLSFGENRHRKDPINSARSYLFKAVKNKSLNIKTRYINKTESLISTENKEEPISETSFEISTDELHQLLRKGLRQLPEQCRRIFLLSRFTSLTYKEIAEHLDVSIKTVETQISIALKKMKQFLLDHGDILGIIWLLVYY